MSGLFAEPASASASLERWRAEILDWILRLTLLLGLPPLAFGVEIAIEDGDFFPVGLTYVVFFAFLVAAAAHRGGDYRVRVSILVVVLLAIGTAILARYGPIGGGRLLFFAAVTQTAAFFGARRASAVLGLSVAVLCAIAFGYLQGILPEVRPAFSHGWVSWGSAILTYVFLSGGVIASVSFIASKLEGSWATCQSLLGEVGTLNRELEERVRARTARLEAVNAELEAFAYSVSHDLRAPLRAINGFSRTLLEDYANRFDDEGKDYLLRVTRASSDLAAMIDDLLKLSRVTRSPLRRSKLDLSRMVREIGDELRSTDPTRQIALDVQDFVVAEGDERLVRIALRSLLDNAWKFTSERTPAEIRFERVPGEEPAYRVRDNGVGFDMAYASKLFKPFERLHPQRTFEGNGIGLATAQRVIAMHSGRIWAEARPGEGASFTFTLSSSAS